VNEAALLAQADRNGKMCTSCYRLSVGGCQCDCMPDGLIKVVSLLPLTAVIETTVFANPYQLQHTRVKYCRREQAPCCWREACRFYADAVMMH